MTVRTQTYSFDFGAVPVSVAGDGPAVVLNHAFGLVAWGDLGAWHDVTVVAPDSPKMTLAAPDARPASAWYDALADAVGVDTYTLAPWSMAAPAAVRFAATGPARLRALVLIDPAGLGAPEGSGPPSLRHHFETREELVRAIATNAVNGWIRSPYVDRRPMFETLYAMWIREGAFENNQQMNRNAVERPLTDVFGDVAVPTLVLAGRWSHVCGPQVGKDIAAALPDGRLEVFNDSSHSLALEEPGHFRAVVTAFVREVGR